MNISLFWSRKQFSITYAIVTFFSRDLSMTNSNFSKTVHTISIKIFIVILHPMVLAPLCAMASKSYGWDVRNIAKINPKWPKPAIFRVFFDFLKTSPFDSKEICYCHSTPYYGPMCARASKSYDLDSSESEGNRPKPTLLPHMRLWFAFVLNLFLDSLTRKQFLILISDP